MEHVWKTHLSDTVAFDPVYHQNKRFEIASFFDRPPGIVLDIGCGGGATGRLLKEKFPGVRMIGIELNTAAAEHARQWMDEVICEDVSTLDLKPRLNGDRLDAVLLLDVLEHLYDPWRTLVRVAEWIDPETRVLASIPNIRNVGNLDELAGGNWTYGPNGVLDVTHVRFFTKKTLRRLFEETGYRVLHMVPLTQPQLLDRYVIERRPGRIVTRNMTIRVRDFEDLEDLYALQYVIEARLAPARA